MEAEGMGRRRRGERRGTNREERLEETGENACVWKKVRKGKENE